MIIIIIIIIITIIIIIIIIIIINGIDNAHNHRTFNTICAKIY